MADLSDAAQEFRDLARNLALVGAGELRQELYTAINDAAKPVLARIRRDMPDYMPDRYAGTLDADLSLSVSKQTGVDTAGVALTGRSRLQQRKLRRVDSGLLTHPLFGNREHWYTQTDGMEAGFFTRPAEESAPRVREAILAAMARIADKATGRL